MADPVLTLDTLVERRIISIDGTAYEMRSPDELSLLDHHRIQKRAERVAELSADLETLDEAQIVELLSALDSFVAQVLLAPADLLAKLKPQQKTRILQVFMQLQPEAMPLTPTAGAKQSEGPSTGL